MAKVNVKLEAKLNKLCSLYEYGAIQLSTSPVDFIERVYTEIVELRKFKARIDKAIKICDNFKREGNNEKEN